MHTHTHIHARTLSLTHTCTHTHHSPVNVTPQVYISINGHPHSIDIWEQTHRTVALHFCPSKGCQEKLNAHVINFQALKSAFNSFVPLIITPCTHTYSVIIYSVMRIRSNCSTRSGGSGVLWTCE